MFHLWKFLGSTKIVGSGNTHTSYIWTEVDWQPSDEHGEFWFNNLLPGFYTVREDLSATDPMLSHRF